MSSETVTREDQKVVTPVGGQIEFVPPFGRQVLLYKEKIKKKNWEFCLVFDESEIFNHTIIILCLKLLTEITDNNNML